MVSDMVYQSLATCQMDLVKHADNCLHRHRQEHGNENRKDLIKCHRVMYHMYRRIATFSNWTCVPLICSLDIFFECAGSSLRTALVIRVRPLGLCHGHFKSWLPQQSGKEYHTISLQCGGLALSHTW